MNIKGFAENLMNTVDNSRDYDYATDDQVVEELVKLLELLEPKDRERFCKWGVPKYQVSPEDCWS